MRRKEAARCDKAAGWRRRGAGRGPARGLRGARGARAAAAPAPHHLPAVSRPPTPLVLVWLAPLRAPHSCPDHDACRSAVAANATSTLPANRSPNLSATCYFITFGHLHTLTRLVYPSSCKCTLILLKCDMKPSNSELALKCASWSLCIKASAFLCRVSFSSVFVEAFCGWSPFSSDFRISTVKFLSLIERHGRLVLLTAVESAKSAWAFGLVGHARRVALLARRPER